MCYGKDIHSSILFYIHLQISALYLPVLFTSLPIRFLFLSLSLYFGSKNATSLILILPNVAEKRDVQTCALRFGRNFRRWTMPFRKPGFTSSMILILLKPSCILSFAIPTLNKILPSCLADFYQFTYQIETRRKERRNKRKIGLRIET